METNLAVRAGQGKGQGQGQSQSRAQHTYFMLFLPSAYNLGMVPSIII